MLLLCFSLNFTVPSENLSLSFSAWLISLLKSNSHIAIWVGLKPRAGQWHKVACCPISRECIVQSSVFTGTGKSAIYTLALALNNGADSMHCALLFPLTLENCSQSRLFLELTVNLVERWTSWLWVKWRLWKLCSFGLVVPAVTCGDLTI